MRSQNFRFVAALVITSMLSAGIPLRRDSASADEPVASKESQWKTEKELTPEQEEQLGHARELIQQVVKLNSEGKYREAIPLAKKAVQLSETILGGDNPEIATDCSWLAVSLKESGDYAAAIPIYQRSLSIYEKALGPEHVYVAQALNNLALINVQQGKYEAALPLYERAIEIREKTGKPDDPDLALVLSNLADLYRDEGKFGDALPVYQRALAIREKVGENRELAYSLSGLSELYRMQGNYTEAMPLQQRALKIREAELGPEHLLVAVSLNNLGLIYEALGNLTEAEARLQRALKINEKVYGPSHREVALNAVNLADVYRAEGKYSEAAELYDRGVKIYEATLGENHPYVAIALNNRGNLEYERGHFAEAISLFQRALKVYENSVGLDHPDAAVSMAGLASVYKRQGKYEEALPLYQRVLAIQEKAYDPGSPQLSNSKSDLASLYQDQGKFAEALPLFQSALEIDEKALGAEHSKVGNDLNNLALLYADQGKYAEALPLYERALRVSEAALGPEHPQVATVLNNLAQLFEQQGKYAEAVPLYERAIKIREKAQGAEHPALAVNLHNLAQVYCNQGNYSAALSLLQRALKINEKAFGEGHPDVALGLQNIAGVHRAQGDYAAALSLNLRAVEILEKAVGPEHHYVASALNDLAIIYENQGKQAVALPLKLRALKIDEKALGPEHPDVATDLNNLAALYKVQGNYAESLPLYRRALKIREKALGPEHPLVGASLNNLAGVISDLGNDAEAVSLLKRALEIEEKTLGPEHPDVAYTLNNLGLIYTQHGNYEEAQPLLERAIEIGRKTIGPEHPDFATRLNNLAILYRAEGKFEEAEKSYQQAIAIREKALGPEHPDLTVVLSNLATLYELEGKSAEAVALDRRAVEIAMQSLELNAAVQSERQQLENIKTSRSYLDAFVSSALDAAGKQEKDALNDGAKVGGNAGTDLPSDVYAQMLAWKGAVTLRQRLERGARESNNAEEKKLWSDLQVAATQLAAASRATQKPEQREAWQERLTELTKQKETLEAELSERSSKFREVRREAKLTPDNLVKVLPADTALVDLLQFGHRVDEKQPDGTYKVRWEERLAAFVLRTGQPVAMIDLGLVEPINQAVELWRGNYGSDLADRPAEEEPGRKLRSLVWEPIAARLEGVKTVVISPDGEMAKFPWSALPGSKPGSYLIEDALGIVLIPVPQMLPELLRANKPAGLGETAASADGEAAKLLLVGDVDYGAAVAEAKPKTAEALFAGENSRPTVRGAVGMGFASLPGTAEEIAEVEKIFHERYGNGETLELTKTKATAEQLREQAPQYRYLHLATHGFYSLPSMAGLGAALKIAENKLVVVNLVPGGSAERDGRLKSGDQLLAVAGDDRVWTSLEGKSIAEAVELIRGPAGSIVRLRVKPAAGSDEVEYQLVRQTFNVGQPAGSIPVLDQYQSGLLSGLVLAGANLPPQSDRDDGIVTALEVAALDLQPVDLAVLSACETGLGQSAGGEGMLGLQRAFQVAGARSTVSSLWSVDDAATQTMMSGFYSRLWNKEHPVGKLEALRQAQLEMLRLYDPRAKKLVDRGRGLELDSEPSETNGRLSPKYWAAFELSGDWR
jgi:tetratricopeptide (TPR) repeat protein